jgi:hypothetical protein
MSRLVADVTIRRGEIILWIAATSVWLSVGFAISVWDSWHHGSGMSFLYDVLILFTVPAIALAVLWTLAKIRSWVREVLGYNS